MKWSAEPIGCRPAGGPGAFDFFARPFRFARQATRVGSANHSVAGAYARAVTMSDPKDPTTAVAPPTDPVEPFSVAGYAFPVIFGRAWVAPVVLAILAIMLISWLGILSGDDGASGDGASGDGASGDGASGDSDEFAGGDGSAKDPEILRLVAAVNSPV